MVGFIVGCPAYLDGRDLPHRRDDYGWVYVTLPFGRTVYSCRVRQEDEDMLHLEAQWQGRVGVGTG